MKWKLLPNIIIIGFLVACQETQTPEIKEDISVKEEKKPEIDSELWKDLEGQWQEIKKNKEYWRAELPCEGEGNSIIFSKRKEEHSFAQFKNDALVKDTNLSLVENKDGGLLLNGEDLKLEAKLQDGILSAQDSFYTKLWQRTDIERIYVDKNTCLGEVSFKGISDIEGEWYDAPCGSMVLKIEGKEFSYREEGSEVLWIQPEKDQYWVTLKKAKKIYGVLIVPKGTIMQLWNGRYDSWKPVNLHKKSKDCAK